MIRIRAKAKEIPWLVLTPAKSTVATADVQQLRSLRKMNVWKIKVRPNYLFV